MIDTNNSSQDYFLMMKISVLVHMARNHFNTHDGFPFFFQKEPESREMQLSYLICNVLEDGE